MEFYLLARWLVLPASLEIALVRPGDGAGGAAGSAGPGEAEAWSEVRASWRPARAPLTPALDASSPLCWGGSRFWALAEVSESEDSEAEDGEGGARRGGGALPSVGDFVARAEELGCSLRAGRRRAFAPGGRGARRPGGPGRASLRSVAETSRPLAGREDVRAVAVAVAAASPRQGPVLALGPVARPGAAAPVGSQEAAAVTPEPWPSPFPPLRPPWLWSVWGSAAAGFLRPPSPSAVAASVRQPTG
ncbi:uncharacterized protein LOC119321663 [Triticum dicoccoides]|uniref:uncharacterized protein LOC119321663 n=1 Tax=Triticum dicoccoides TaxID=85692 RepID=UPI001891EBEF|nr:uncharacterized protein LOC119321663 [Triticum dicoccoides]